METNNISKNFILVDTSYWVFYRFHAILQWWKHVNPDENISNPYQNEEFINKFTKTFMSSIESFKKKFKLNKQRGLPEIPCNVIACKDCSRKEIWRNKFYKTYKETREKNDTFIIGQFFKYVYSDDNKLLLNSGINNILEFPNLECDDIIALTKKYIRSKYPKSNIYIIANDHDYLQLMDINTHIINFQYKNLRESKNVFKEAEKNLFYKIVLGDKSDNINPVFKKCGPKTCEKYYENNEEFLKALKTEDGAQIKYELNKKIIDFNEIPELLVNGFLEEYKNLFINL